MGRRDIISATTHQEEAVDKQVEKERGEFVARVVVVPDEDLDWYHNRGVEQQRAAHEEDGCRGAR